MLRLAPPGVLALTTMLGILRGLFGVDGTMVWLVKLVVVVVGHDFWDPGKAI